MLLFAEAEQLKVEASSMQSAEFLEKYKIFDADVRQVMQWFGELKMHRHGYEPNVAIFKVSHGLSCLTRVMYHLFVGYPS